MQTQNDEYIAEKTSAWLNNQEAELNKPPTLIMPNIFAQEWNSSNLSTSALALQDESDPTNPFFSPSSGFATGDYISAANKNASSGTVPISIQEGLQTSIDIARRRSGYDPVDQPTTSKPHTKGDHDHFIAFTNEISKIPFLSLINAENKIIEQKSHNANDLIDSFAAAFTGLKNQDIEGIKKSLTQLTKAALSYADKKEEQSNFTQNILQQENNDLHFMLYSSIFTISATAKKGTIIYQSSYTLTRAIYSVSLASWNNVKNKFCNQQKTETEDWLKNITTPSKQDSTVRAICLEGK
ncbi:hypothetical protein I9018_18080 [Pseudomonas sp. MPFS]|uniref:hypothetical protein n=1 Tax=Pseudomonas sp. MPFS TaxID=2795724 RepID=UPI001F143CA6|nr:hypothetical protein [Pseudomonas sp. MPFS]UMZ09449.1 hypothetical protein I9018_18080 [Pseudomonas sp. MPFS]